MTNSGKCLLYKVLSFAVYALPMVLLFFLNMGEYASDGSVFGFFGYIILFFVILTFKNTFVELFKTRTLMCVSAVLLVFSVLMQYLADNMILICAVSFIGAVMQSLVSVVADVYDRYSYITIDGIKRRNLAKAIPDKQAWAEAYGFMLTEESDG